MADKKDSTFDVISGIMLYIYLGITLILVLGALFGGGGIESEENKTVFLYAEIMGLIGISIMFVLKFGQWLVQYTNNYKKLGFIGCVIHDPEESGFPIQKKSFSWIKNPFLLALATLPLFSLLGTIQVFQNTFFNAIPSRVSQQVQESSQLLLSIFPSELEVMVPSAFAGFLLAINLWLLKTKKIDIATHYIIRFLGVPILFTVTWVTYHLWRYQNSSISISYVIIFAIICSYLLVTFMSIVPVILFKITNNLYQYLNGAIASNEVVLIFTVVLNVVIIVILVWIFTARKATRSRA